MKKQYLWFLLLSLLFVRCSLEQEPMSEASKSSVFGSQQGLDLYAMSFYNGLPGADDIHRADNMADYTARRNAPPFLQETGFGPTTSSNTSESGWDLVALGADWNWGWGTLRNINYFIQNCNDPVIAPDVKKNYLGLARFFRAWFYFEKVKRYGDVPWISKALDVTDTIMLYKKQDPRAMVMDSVLADIDYACQNIKATSDASKSLVTKYIAYAFKARICLFEGTFRKYHTELNLQGTASTWLTASANAAKYVMDNSGFKLYEGAGTDLSYRTVFTTATPVPNSEVMMAAIMDLALSVTHAANWVHTSSTTGVRFNFIRTFINTYLNLDGTPFTNNPNYQTMLFKDEVKNRDKRLKQTIRLGDYKRLSAGLQVATPPAFAYTYTGYQPIKWCLDDVYYDTRNLNINPISYFRYAEVLLNYAEAKAELGSFTDADWALTVGALRKRAGITGGLTIKPTVVDPYMQTKYFPDITDPVILEIRRDRGIELCMEGFRYYDIMRWKRGPLLEMEWNGIYVPELNTPQDLNEDGKMDVAFYKTMPSPTVSGVTYINVSNTTSNPAGLKNGTSGELTWLTTIPRKWEDKKYYFPIPESHRLTNPNLVQNPGW
jgi:hypothetical protein